jgi:hypothetical protein
MLAVRMEVAVGICTKFPTLYNKLQVGKFLTITKDELPAATILANLIGFEPVIRKVLELYYQ